MAFNQYICQMNECISGSLTTKQYTFPILTEDSYDQIISIESKKQQIIWQTLIQDLDNPEGLGCILGVWLRPTSQNQVIVKPI